MFLSFVLAITCVAVGFLCGSTGVGGIILIPALTYLAGMDTHTAMSVALASFVFAAAQIAWLYYRRGLLEWRVVLPFAVGGLIMGFAGAKAKALLAAPVLNAALALLILLAAFNILRPAQKGGYSFATAPKKQHDMFLFILGGFVGFVAGLTGVGGPIISIPVMIYFGFTPICAIAAGQAFTVGAALSGTAGNILYSHMDWFIIGWTTVAQMAGIVWGVRLACRVPAKVLQRAVAVVCLVLGFFLLGQALFAMLA